MLNNNNNNQRTNAHKTCAWCKHQTHTDIALNMWQADRQWKQSKRTNERTYDWERNRDRSSEWLNKIHVNMVLFGAIYGDRKTLIDSHVRWLSIGHHLEELQPLSLNRFNFVTTILNLSSRLFKMFLFDLMMTSHSRMYFGLFLRLSHETLQKPCGYSAYLILCASTETIQKAYGSFTSLAWHSCYSISLLQYILVHWCWWCCCCCYVIVIGLVVVSCFFLRLTWS